MGYTHYWEFDGDGETFGRTALDAQRIVEHAATIGISIKGPMGAGEPEFTEGKIALNGDESKGEDYETFAITAEGTGFDFCKTRGDMPYDAVVTAILIRFAQHGGTHVGVRSDGEWDEWKAGRQIVDELFGDCPSGPIFTERD